MRHLLDKLRREQEPSVDTEIEHFRAQQRLAAAKLTNGQHVYDEIDRAARAWRDEVYQPRPETPPHKA